VLGNIDDIPLRWRAMNSSPRSAAFIVVVLQMSAAFFVLCALSSLPEVAANLRFDCRRFEAAMNSLAVALAHHWMLPFFIAVFVGHALPIAYIARAGFMRALPIQAFASAIELIVIGAMWLTLVSHFLLLHEGRNCF
jgi:hypothetical protein